MRSGLIVKLSFFFPLWGLAVERYIRSDYS